MKSQANKDLKKKFDKEFNNAKTLREVLETQKPTETITLRENGKIILSVRVYCN